MKIGDKIISFFMGLVSPSKRKTNKFMDDYVSKLRAIEMSDKGFVIVGFSEVKEVEIKWSSVNDVIYEKEKVTIKMNGQREMIIPRDFHINWYGLIRKVPKGYPSYDYNLVELFFANLTGCEICGLKGVNEEE